MTADPLPSRPVFRQLLRQAALNFVRRVGGGGKGVPGPERLKRLLFLQYDPALGSVVTATPVFEAVRKAFPQAEVTVAASGISLDVLRHNPFIDRIVPTPDPHKSFAAAAWSLLTAGIRRNIFDLVLTDAGNMKARIGFLAALARARARVGFTTAPELFDLPLRRNPALSMREEHFRLVAALGSAVPSGGPRLFFGTREAGMAERLLGPSDPFRPRIVLVTQTSGGQPTRWFDDRFAAVADHLGKTYGAALYFVGTARDAGAIDRILGAMRQEGVNLAGRTDIATLAALLCQCDLAVSLDTGTLHMAHAAALPTVVIAAAWQPAYEWLPLGVPGIDIVRRDDIGCRECRKISCATHECMDEIAPGAVIAAIEALWEKYPPSAAARRIRTERSVVSRPEGSS